MCRPSQTPHPTMSSAGSAGRREAGLGSKKRGDAPPPRIPLVRTGSEAAVRRPGKVPEGTLPSVPRPARGDPLSPREQLEQSTDSRRVRDRDPRAQPSQPILFPRLRIHFADFPCLHCSIDRRLFTLETRCGSPGAHRTPRDVRCSSSRLDPTSGRAVSGVGRLLNRKDNSSRGPRRRLRTP
ncbi:unnamed protein product [Prunus brigantina]